MEVYAVSTRVVRWTGGGVAEPTAGQYEGDRVPRDARGGRLVRGEAARGLGLRAARPGRAVCRPDLVDRRDEPRLPAPRGGLRELAQGLQQETGARAHAKTFLFLV